MVPASWLRGAPGIRRAAFADTFNAAEVMAMRSGDGHARQAQQAFAGGAAVDELEKHIACPRSPGAPGGAHPMSSFDDDDDHKPWTTDQPARDDTPTVTPGAGRLQVTPMAWQTHMEGSHAL